MAASVDDVRVWRAPDHTRVVFDLSESVSYNIFTLSNPERLVIDLSQARLDTTLDSLEFADSPLRSIRASTRDDTNLRVVLDLTVATEHESFTLGANGEFKDRLVIDLFDESSSGGAPAAAASTAYGATTNTTTATTRRQPGISGGQRDIIVAVVAGHGGEDPGAPSYDRKFWEKDVTLAVSRAIRDRLDATPGYRALMIRDGDYSVELQERPKIAREGRVDIYLSIHADSYRGRDARGVTIYALSGEIADRENARRIAMKENRADLMGGTAGDTSIANVDDDLALTLLDLSMAWSLEQSAKLGSHILGSLDGVATLRRDKVQGGNLWELRSPDIPSVLIETGYLSHPAEAQQLMTRGYQETLADAIVHGVMNYFYEAPPPGTMVAWQKANGIKPVPSNYVVRRGDSLSEIAQRFGVSMSALKLVNGLQGNTIRIGQILDIPGSAPQQVSEHRITRGETLSEIAQRYRVSLSSLRQANNLRGDTIMVGQILKIPAS